MSKEIIKTIGRLAYVKLFDWPDYPKAKRSVSMNDGEYKQLFWRFYWREA